ncbi:UNVERIFIED_CONTAM: hypothetical protein GTU68_013429 [Idotea baltica]|nr:hypothetical protein [Idotea baltica]
MRPSESTSRS